jgi:hypothetical protein
MSKPRWESDEHKAIENYRAVEEKSVSTQALIQREITYC